MDALNLYSVGLLFSLSFLLAIAYIVRVFVRGRVQYERIDREGGSRLLSKKLMEMGYWSIQPLARFLVARKISANTISWVALCLGVLSGICLGFGQFGAGAFIALVAGALDALDGLVARMSGALSMGGKILDSTLDRYVEFVLVGAMVIYYRELPMLQVVSLGALLGSFMVSYSTALGEILKVPLGRGSMRRAERMFYLVLGSLLSAVTIPLWEVSSFSTWNVAPAIPMALSLALIAGVANWSAFRRVQAIIAHVRHQPLNPAEAVVVPLKAIRQQVPSPMPEPIALGIASGSQRAERVPGS